MELTNEQRARIFAMYWGAKIQRRLFYASDGSLHSTNYFTVDAERLTCINKHPPYNNISKAIDELMLTPLHAISDEHKLSLLKIHGYTEVDSWELNKSLNQFDHVFRVSFNKKDMPANIYQQLILWCYAVPLFIESGHPDNGCNAIELGIAIDKTLTP